MDHRVGGVEQIRHAVGEAEDPDPRLGAEARAQRLARHRVAAGERDHPRATDGEGHVDRPREVADAPAAPGHQDRGAVADEAEARTRHRPLRRVQERGRHERAHERRAPPARDALDRRDRALVHHQVQVHAAMSPERVAAEVRDGRAHRDVERAAEPQPAERRGERRMRRDDDVGAGLADERDQSPPRGPREDPGGECAGRSDAVRQPVEDVIRPRRPSQLGSVSVPDQVGEERPERGQALAYDDLHPVATAQPLGERAGGGGMALAHVGGEHQDAQVARRPGLRHDPHVPSGA